MPLTARDFAPGPYRRLVTYTVWSNRPRDHAPEWIREYEVFYLPRPWPLWMRYLDRSALPIAAGAWTAAVALAAVLGLVLVCVGVRGNRCGRG